ncbi:HK97 gp10 family phage protein [Corallococcus carmarthensis]|uniref:HK97 gp10 family phage protein n=1 Tax=Corallococcus carmarthensis TaxID=2316728 RepID=A0A3A8KC23_9BACT|nr:HK97 gp10 family phage protein [Corallococcus carmarthensis]RKH05076.1 HK97 gp10 family phage protein [Corallococcus carmarthensis]
MTKVDSRIRKGARFSKQVQASVKATQAKANEVVRKTALGVLANVVTASPVDTGRFRGNWQVGIAERPAGTVEAEDKDGSGTISREGAKLEGVELGDTVFITNNLPYARRIEFGWSQQAPKGVVRTTLAQLDEILEEAAK